MVRNRNLTRVTLAFLLTHGLLAQSFEAKINQCLWIYSNSTARFKIINDITIKTMSLMKRMTVPNRIGNEVSFDFIPGSLDQEPIIITGGLWYKIEYFKGFSNVLTTQSNFKEVLVEVENMRTEVERQTKVINELSSKGHPIIIVSRETQPESIYESLKKGLIPSYANTAPEVAELLKTGKFKKNDRKYSIKS